MKRDHHSHGHLENRAVCMYVHVGAFVCVCVRERERDSEIENTTVVMPFFFKTQGTIFLVLHHVKECNINRKEITILIEIINGDGCIKCIC